MSADTETLARKVREEVIKPEQSTLISPDRQSPSLLRREATVEPRFELFHFVFSVCSQKVRGTLMEKGVTRSEEHTSELQSLMRISYAVFCLKKKKINTSEVKYAQ